MSHLMAFLAVFLYCYLLPLRHFDPGSPGPGPRPKRSHWTNDGFGVGTEPSGLHRMGNYADSFRIRCKSRR